MQRRRGILNLILFFFGFRYQTGPMEQQFFFLLFVSLQCELNTSENTNLLKNVHLLDTGLIAWVENYCLLLLKHEQLYILQQDVVRAWLDWAVLEMPRMVQRG